MDGGRQPVTDLLLDGAWKPGAGPARPMALLDAPRVEREERQARFNWRPTLVLLLLVGVIFLAVGYL